MQKNISASCFTVLASLAIFATGCATTQQSTTATATPDPTKLYDEAVAAFDAGQREKGLQLLDASARANPASAEPWIKAAQVHFDAENYPSAIEAADEAMKRDPARRETKAIAVVASLRVAVRALADMSQDTSLRGNTRSEAERLARTLRETLGQDVLVPVPAAEPEPRTPARRPAAKPAPRRAPAAAPQAPQAQPSRVPQITLPDTPAVAKPVAPAMPSVKPEVTPPSNPFSVLK